MQQTTFLGLRLAVSSPTYATTIEPIQRTRWAYPGARPSHTSQNGEKASRPTLATVAIVGAIAMSLPPTETST